MGMHGCNELCNISDHAHDAQRDLLPMEGHEENAKELLIEALKRRIKKDTELLEELTK